MAGFFVQAQGLGAQRENSVWAGGVGDGREVDGELDWSFFSEQEGSG